jgi:hypothetical protein
LKNAHLEEKNHNACKFEGVFLPRIRGGIYLYITGRYSYIGLVTKKFPVKLTC